MRRIFWPGLAAGFLAGTLVTLVQAAIVTPLIIAAEGFEAPHDHGSDEWEPGEGLERFLFTWLANLVVGCGFGLVLAAAFALASAYGRGALDWRRGIVWGLAGYAAFSLAPALGLPPELPGAASAELAARQGWWVATALATAGGIGCLVWGGRVARLLGVVLLALPHLVGAPHPEAHDHGTAPAALALSFVFASLGAAAVFWVALGGSLGFFFARAERA